MLSSVLMSLYSVVGPRESERPPAGDGYRSCRTGCGSKFRNEAPLARHEAVCTYNQITWMGHQGETCQADTAPHSVRELTTRRGRGRGKGPIKSPEKSGKRENLPWSKWIKKK